MKKQIMLWAIGLCWGLSHLSAMEPLSFRQALDLTRTELLLPSKYFSWHHFSVMREQNNTRRDDTGNTLLHWRIVWYAKHHEASYLEAIRCLLKDPMTRHDIENNYGVTAFDLAEDAKEEIIIKMMLKESREIPWCFQKPHIVKTRELLLSQKEYPFEHVLSGDPNQEIPFFGGNTFLHWLVAWHNENTCADDFGMIEHLLCDPRTQYDIENRFGVTAFELAQDTGDCDVIELMLNRDCNFSHDFFAGLVKEGNIFGVSILLKNRYLDVNARSFDRTALDWAALSFDCEMTKILLTHPNLDPNAQDWRGNTTLHVLVLWVNASEQPQYLELINLLLSDPRTRCDVRNYNLLLSENRLRAASSLRGKGVILDMDKEGGKTVYELAVINKLIMEKFEKYRLLLEQLSD